MKSLITELSKKELIKEKDIHDIKFFYDFAYI